MDTLETRGVEGETKMALMDVAMSGGRGGAGAGSEARMAWALAVLRVIAGIVFVAHGSQKLFGWGLAGVIGGFQGMGIPLPVITAPAVSFLEFFGGIALVAGLFTRPIAAGLAVVMLGATLLVHLSAGFFAPNGIEFTLVLFGVSVALALLGAGAYSVDGMLARRRSAG